MLFFFKLQFFFCYFFDCLSFFLFQFICIFVMSQIQLFILLIFDVFCDVQFYFVFPFFPSILSLSFVCIICCFYFYKVLRLKFLTFLCSIDLIFSQLFFPEFALLRTYFLHSSWSDHDFIASHVCILSLLFCVCLCFSFSISHIF